MSLENNIDKKIEELKDLFIKSNNKKHILDKAIKDKSLGNIDNYEKELDIWRQSLSDTFAKISPALKEIKQGNKTNLDVIIAYLRVKERYFRSGYLKSRIARSIRKLRFEDNEKKELAKVIIDSINASGEEFKEIAKLVPYAYHNKLENDIEQIKADNNSIKSRKLRILERIKKIEK